MFDTATLELMGRARPLDGLDLEELPRLLTEAYAQVVATRLRIAAGDQAVLGQDWPEMERKFGRIAATYEVVTLMLPDQHEHREGTAFVAASAHHARVRARAVLNPPGVGDTTIGRSYLGPAVSAALLFSIGGHQADAGEVAQSLRLENPRSIEEILQDAVANLSIASGESLQALVAVPRPDLAQKQAVDEQAYETLLIHLLDGISATAAMMLGVGTGAAQRHFDKVLQATADGPRGEASGAPTRLGFKAPGVRQLALLLEAASHAMLNAAVATLPPPNDVDAETWSLFLHQYARKRPLLWRNHLSAMSSGLLDSGKSAVMSFPTGAGKSALAEFRAAAEHLRGRKTIYLCPTKALAAQVRRQLGEVLKPLGRPAVRSYLGNDTPEVGGFDVAVMTPEACLVLAVAEPDAIANTGLIIFDECHLLTSPPSGSGKVPSRRAIDANLALLQTIKQSEDADVLLLSAMVANAEDLAGWIASVTGRPCSAQTDPWKPTRQIRGVLAYQHAKLQSLLKSANSMWATKRREAAQRNKKLPKSPGVAIQREMLAVPWGVFCHKQAWDVDTSFKSLPILADAVPLKLSTNQRGLYFTPNRNVVAGKIAAAFVGAGLRPLVFVQDITGTRAVGHALVKELGSKAYASTDLPLDLIHLAGAELGDQGSSFGLVGGRVACHHALLLPSEREAMERAYRDDERVVAMTATPTLAQGMNLPAQVVIIAGDNRWEDDDNGGHPETLSVHEILNAAGRAGRAGMFAQGLVFLVPGLNVFSIDHRGETIYFDGLEHAASLLGSPDQCLVVEDPLTRVMDLAADGGEVPDVVGYTLRRLQFADDVGAARSARLLNATLGGYIAGKNGLRDQFEALVAGTLATARDLARDTEASPLDDLARSLGASPAALDTLVGALPANRDVADYTPYEWAKWLVAYLSEHPTHLADLMHIEASGLLRVFKEREDEEWHERCSRIVMGLRDTLPLWLDGSPLSILEPKLFEHSGRKRATARLALARRFHNETGPALGGVGYLLRRLVDLRGQEAGEPAPQSIQLEALPGCMASGLDSPMKLALYQELAVRGATTRVVVHAKFAEIEFELGTVVATNLGQARKAVSKLLSETAD